MSPKRIRASDLGKLSFCEHRVRLEALYGDQAPEHIRQRRDGGTEAHSRFEHEGRSDRRCFVATCVFGSDAPQTNSLRAFRDRALLPTPLGRCLVAIYYAVSPLIVPVLEGIPVLATGVRKLLDAVVRRLP